MIFNMNYGGGGSVSGVGFSFTIVDGTTRPTEPSQNMLWACTEHESTSYVFSATEPEEPESGMLWVGITDKDGMKVSVPVGAEWIVLRILCVKQYVGEEWVELTSMIYSGCEWLPIKNVTLETVSEELLVNEVV